MRVSPPGGNFSRISTNSTKAGPLWQFPWLVIFHSTIKITWNSTKNNYFWSSSFVQLKTSYILMTIYNLFFKSLARRNQTQKKSADFNVPDHGAKCPTKHGRNVQVWLPWCHALLTPRATVRWRVRPTVSRFVAQCHGSRTSIYGLLLCSVLVRGGWILELAMRIFFVHSYALRVMHIDKHLSAWNCLEKSHYADIGIRWKPYIYGCAVHVD